MAGQCRAVSVVSSTSADGASLDSCDASGVVEQLRRGELPRREVDGHREIAVMPPAPGGRQPYSAEANQIDGPSGG